MKVIVDNEKNAIRVLKTYLLLILCWLFLVGIGEIFGYSEVIAGITMLIFWLLFAIPKLLFGFLQIPAAFLRNANYFLLAALALVINVPFIVLISWCFGSIFMIFNSIATKLKSFSDNINKRHYEKVHAQEMAKKFAGE